MAYSEKYRFKFESDNGQTYTIRILQDGYSGSVKVRHLGDSPILRLESSDNGCIHGSSLEFKPETQIDGEFADLYTSDAREFQVVLESGSTIVWKGFVSPELYGEPDIAPPYDVTVTATDGLGELRRYGWVSRKHATDTMSIYDAIRIMLEDTGLSLPILTNSTISSYGRVPTIADASDTLTSSLVEFEWAYEDGMSMYDMLSRMMESLNAHIRQYNGSWLIIRDNDIEFNANKFANIYNILTKSASPVDVKNFGSADNHDIYPVGNLFMEIVPSKKKVSCTAPNHYRSMVKNGDFSNGVENWTTNGGAYIGEDGTMVLPQGASISQTINLWNAQPGKYKLTVDARNIERTSNPISIKVTAHDERGNQHNLYHVDADKYMYRSAYYGYAPYRKGISVNSRRTIASGFYFGDASGDGISFDMNGAVNMDISDNETMELEVPLPVGVRVQFIPSAVTIEITNIGTNGDQAVSCCFLEPLYQLKGWHGDVEVNNSAREELADVEMLFSHTNVTSGNATVYLPSAPHSASAPISTWRTSKIGDNDIVTLMASDYAMTYAMPRERKSGIFNVPKGSTALPIIMQDDHSQQKYIIETCAWDLASDNWDASMISLPSATLSIESITLTETNADIAGVSHATTGNAPEALFTSPMALVIGNATAFIGIYPTASELPNKLGAGWALVGSNANALTLYTLADGSTTWKEWSGRTYSLTDFDNMLRYTSQTLTEEQKRQARQNIGAASANEIDSLKDILPNEQRDKFVVADAVGNIMLQVDKDGVHYPTVIDEKSHKDGFYITDALGYVIFKADKDGVQFAGNSGEGNNWLFGKNLFSLGDSLSEANVWQRKLAQLTGCVFSSAKNTDPSKPISVGGTATLAAASGVDVAKCGFQRARNLVSLADAKDVVIIENINDINYLSLGGSISDLPYMQYADGSNNGNPRTLYAAYKGLVEYLRTNLPESLIMWLIPTRFGTSFSNPFRRADGSLDIDAYKASDTNYQRLVAIQKEVCQYYGIPVLDMQSESGITYINGATFYYDNNVHPKQIGYERWGTTIARLITGK